MLTLAVFAAASPVYGGKAYYDPLYEYTVTSDVVYRYNAPTPSGNKNLLCDIYQPVDIGLGPVPTNRPAIVIQDGGAWTSGSKTNGRVVNPARYICRRGFTVIITDYRYWEAGYYLGGFTGGTEFGSRPYSGLSWPWYLSVFPGVEVLKADIEDFAVAMAWVRDNAASLGIDPNKIGCCGGSAGGIDALCLQYNNPPVPVRYRAKAVMGIVSTMYGNWNRINASGPPVWLLNNVLDPVIFYSPDVEPDLHNRLNAMGIHYEQFFQEAKVNHDFDYNECIYDPNDSNLPCIPVMERMKDFFCYYLAGGPLQVGYTLSLAANPPGAGAIDANPPPRGDGTYEGGTVVTLLANPGGGYLFSSWSGGASGANNPTQVTMNAHKSVTANFIQGRTLTLNVVNDKWGTVTVEPNLPLYAPGTTVALAAIPIEGKYFDSWTIYDPNYPGDPNHATVDPNLTITIVMNADMQVEAMFKCGSGMTEALPLLVIGLAVLGFISRRALRRS